MSSREICKDLGLSKSSASNTLQTLISGKIVFPTKDVPTRYAIRKQTSLRHALKLLDSLSGEWGYTESKQKLTLAIRKDVIERAKDIGINISAITEEFLKAVTYEHFDRSQFDIEEAYLALFGAIWPVVKVYNLVVEVGESSSTNKSGKVTLEPLSLSHELWLPHLRTERSISSIGPELHNLYAPREVLENLIEAVNGARQNDKLKLQHLEISLKLAKAIFAED
jgi:hypothetical protein